MPFPFQTTGALRGGVPNQIGSMTPQNNEGLGVPWGRAMFNLPRYQMPGSDINFTGGFNSPLGQSQLGMQPGGVGASNVRFSLTRQASSDPVKNIINDIQNPLGGMSLNFDSGQGAPAPLKQRMMGGDTQGGYGLSGNFTGQKPTSALSGLGFEPQLPGSQGFTPTLPGTQGFGGGTPDQLGYPSQAPFGFLRGRMLAQPQQQPLLPQVFI